MAVSPNPKHWLDGEISMETVLQPSMGMFTWNMETVGAERAAVSTSCTCPIPERTAIREDSAGRKRSRKGCTIDWMGFTALMIYIKKTFINWSKLIEEENNTLRS